jgi:hypothetical protein
VSLDPLHEQIARIALALPEAGQVALAGGGAMFAHDHLDVIGGRLPNATRDGPSLSRRVRRTSLGVRQFVPSISGCRVRTPAGAPLARRLARGAVRDSETCTA